MPDFSAMRWLNEPPEWHLDGDDLSVTTGKRTDFWRETHYGFVRDDGHFLFTEASGDFTAEVTFNGRYEHLYDQAGLMVRLDERHWVKAGVEFNDGERQLSTVVTRERSDWSVAPMSGDAPKVTLRLTLRSGALLVQVVLEGGGYRLLRLTDFPVRDSVMVGVMCCSPEREGFQATFSNFRVGPPQGALHGE